ncbi:MAG: hypothetical protein U0Y82_00520 [Thermoleophilia bacterium]
MADRPAPESRPIYPLSEAARYARVAATTLRNWAEGYRVADHVYPPLLELPEERQLGQLLLSFENLIEAALIGAWRRRGISLQRIRTAHQIASAEFGAHPFSRQRVWIGGRDLFALADASDTRGASFTTLTQGGQRALAPAIEQYLETIDWQSGVASAWRPPEGENVVRLNPRVDFGLPAVRGVRTEILLQRFLAREHVPEIAADFGLEPFEVEQALRYEWALQQPLARAA